VSDTTFLNDRLMARRAGPVEDDPDLFQDCGTHGLLRGSGDRALMLECRFRDGNREAFPYALLERVSFDPSEGLMLHFPGARVTFRGRNLSIASLASVSLLDAILRHRVPWVAESEELHAATRPKEAAVVTRIEILEGAGNR
jgi:hypothetical protein